MEYLLNRNYEKYIFMTMGLVYDFLIIGGCYKARATMDLRHKKRRPETS